MTLFTLRSAEHCRFDAVCLGEVMLRLDPGNGRVRTTRQFQVWEGGGEFSDRGNTAASQLRKGDIDWDHIFGTLTAGSGPVAGRGADQKTRPRGQAAVKRKPGTASAGQTGTVAPQGGTIDRVLTKAP